MAALLTRRSICTPSKFKFWALVFNQNNDISTTNTLNLREIKETKKDDVTVIEGVYVESPKAKKLIQYSKDKGACPLCKLKVTYTDVLIISQFIGPNGGILPKSATGLCGYKQEYMKKLIHKAQVAGLMPELRPPLEGGKIRTNPQGKYKFKKFKVYFDDDENDEDCQYATYKNLEKTRPASSS